MLDSRKRFSKIAKVYNDYRPSYSTKLVDWIIKTTKFKNGTLVDIGCGTGISTRPFLNKGFDIIGIDPNDEMLTVAREKGGKFYKKGEAEKTGLLPKSVNIIVSAQAMHWFDLKPTFKEFKRILKPGGWCFAFWNVRKDTALVKDYDFLMIKYSKDHSKTPKAVEVIRNIKNSKEVKSVIEGEFSITQKFNFERLIGRAFSSSYVVHGVRDKEKFKKKLKELFNKYQKNDYVIFDYKTVAIGWQFH